ncbi:MAG: pyruvate formate lyase family protein [Dehalococcoidia bacterium]|nr:pyruvate formate lyase family protein [Dehalococcoidia bacterium]MDD5493905.1 pyruvate formate lyase family protein [Dehalococcoidia bacterium]
MITAEELRKTLTIKGVRNVRRGMETKDDAERGMYRPEVRIGMERGRFLTESYKMTEGEPMVIRRAKALEHILRNMTIYIQDHECIVGNYAESPHDIFMPIDMTWRSFRRAVVEEDGKSLLDDKGKAELQELCRYWDGKSVRDIQVKAFEGCPQLDKYWQYEGTYLWSHWYGLGVPDYEKLLKIGLKGILAQIEERLQEIRNTIPYDYFQQKNFLEAAAMSIKAVIAWAHRYADKARELAGSEKNPQRKKELEAIAATCDRVPENPARTFQEALQSFYFVHCVTRQIEFVSTGIGIRFDLCMGPFYKKDIEAGRITRGDALDLLKRLWIKFEGQGFAYSQTLSGIYGGVQTLSAMNIGGVDRDGNDVTNEMTYLVLDTAKEMMTLQPNITLRIHKGTPTELFNRATDVIATGVGYPSLFNDEALVPLLQRWGSPLEEARDYAMAGCVYIEIPGKNGHRRMAGYFNLAKCLWWALHRGINPKTGEQYGAPTKDPATFKSIEEVMDAFLEQVRFFVHKMIQIEEVTRSVYEEYLPLPFLSAVTKGCIERGKDLGSFKDPNDGICNYAVAAGQANVADALAAIRKFVFDNKEISMKELIAVLDKNWAGNEVLHQKILTQAPKFGNNDDYVDQICNFVHCKTEEIIEEIADKYGARYHFDGSVVSTGYSLGADTPATPDGRRDGDELSDASLSPMIGRDVKGPTAVLASCAKIDPLKGYNQLLNQRFLPQFLKGANKDVFVNYLKSWRDLRIPHIQFNVVDSETLRDAQKHPEKYTNLVVRVAGYSAYFVDLSKGLQDSIISRTEQGF